MPTAETAARPVTLLNSGPAGGVVASQYLGRLLGRSELLAIDMGGTSFDVSLVSDGQPVEYGEPMMIVE